MFKKYPFYSAYIIVQGNMRCQTMILIISVWPVHAEEWQVPKMTQPGCKIAECTLFASSPCMIVFPFCLLFPGWHSGASHTQWHAWICIHTLRFTLLQFILCKYITTLSSTGRLYVWAPCLDKLNHHVQSIILSIPCAMPARSLRRSLRCVLFPCSLSYPGWHAGASRT